MFDLPGQDDVVEVVVNEEAALSEASPLLIYGETASEAASAG
jgi:ATP-dependent Clp protease ATP-binding subunit ClpX